MASLPIHALNGELTEVPDFLFASVALFSGARALFLLCPFGKVHGGAGPQGHAWRDRPRGPL